MKNKLKELFAFLLRMFKKNSNPMIELDSEKESKSKTHIAISPKIIIVLLAVITLLEILIRCWFGV